ncbi:D-glycerate dehydrogenase [Novosphingobium sp. 1949]|uniref:D-glycerate dehydrogenase n=1 Tax=Novosphingobium organovorum TaxID=2930092 RepID=A0ABT0B7V8_9SPHN|nr:D-glycerate dehydrogenase [Novosphingobium organovorum]MCJ2181152.1 D-glycerate dehydrogenase [Novosphingobium organovorum]
MSNTNASTQDRPDRVRPRVVVTRRLPAGVESRMSELFDTVFNPSDTPMSREALRAALAACDVLVPTVTDTIDRDLLESAGQRLGLIANFGAGTEHIDLRAARERHILVTNTPGVFTDDTADLAFALLILAMRRFVPGARALLDGAWQGWAPTAMLGQSLAGKTLAIVGMGRIGQAVAHRARAFGMRVHYHNRHRLPQALENILSAHYEPDLERLFATADALTLHCPLAASTRHLVNAERLALMKPSACIINTGRGDLVDEEALVAALETGRIAGAGLDVFAHEPNIDPRLLAAPNLVALPHLGSATFEGRETAGEKIIANIRFWADGHRPPDQVLPE